jgi:hypothetical protein
MKKLKTKVLGSASYSSIDNDKVLSSSSLDAKFFGHAGFPATSDSLAYDPIQRLLAVRTKHCALRHHVPVKYNMRNRKGSIRPCKGLYLEMAM